MFFTILYHHFPPYLLFISIQQKERLKWLWGIHLKSIKALIFNHNIQLLGKSRETFRKFTQIRLLETLDTSCIFPQFSVNYILGFQILPVKTIPRMHQSEQFPPILKNALFKLANVEVLGLKSFIFSLLARFFFFLYFPNVLLSVQIRWKVLKLWGILAKLLNHALKVKRQAKVRFAVLQNLSVQTSSTLFRLRPI